VMKKHEVTDALAGPVIVSTQATRPLYARTTGYGQSLANVPSLAEIAIHDQ